MSFPNLDYVILATELRELTTKLNALHVFTNTHQFLGLDPIDRLLLLKQYKHMHKYAKILKKRTDRFLDRPPQTTGVPQ